MSQNILSFDLFPNHLKSVKLRASHPESSSCRWGLARPPRTHRPATPGPRGSPTTGTENILCLLFLIRSFNKYFVRSPHCAGGTWGGGSERLRAAAFGAPVPSPGNLQSLPRKCVFFPPGWGGHRPRPPPAAQPSAPSEPQQPPCCYPSQSS